MEAKLGDSSRPRQPSARPSVYLDARYGPPGRPEKEIMACFAYAVCFLILLSVGIIYSAVFGEISHGKSGNQNTSIGNYLQVDTAGDSIIL